MFNQRRQNAQQGYTRAFNTFEANEPIQANFDRAHDASSRRGERLTARRESSVVRGRGRGRVVGRGRAMSSQSPANKLEQGLNESLFDSPWVSQGNQAQGIFTRKQKYSSLFKPAQKPSVLGSSQQQQQQQQQQNVANTTFDAPQKDVKPSSIKPAFSMPRSAAFDFTFTAQKPEFGGARQQQQQQQQQQQAFGGPSFGGKASTFLGAGQHQPPFGGNARAVQQSGYSTKGYFNETDAENIAPNDSIKNQHTGNLQQSNEAAFGRYNLNAQAVPFQPATTIGRQALNPQAVPFHPARPIGEQGLDPQAPPFKPSYEHIDHSFYLYEPVESTPQPIQQGTNESRRQRARKEKLRLREEQKLVARKEKAEQDKARRMEAEAWWRRQEEEYEAIEEQQLEELIKRTAELTLFSMQEYLQDQEEQNRRQRALQEKLRLEEEQKIMARKEQEEQEEAHRIEVEALRRRQEAELKEKEEQEKACRLEAEALRRRQEAELKEKEEQEKARRLKAEAEKRLQEEMRKRKANEECLKKIAAAYKMKRNKMQKLVQEKSKLWLSRSRHNIEKRNASIARRAEILRFSVKLHNNNPYSSIKIDNLYKRYKLRTPEIMEDRAKIALQSEKIAEQFNLYKDEDQMLSYVWKKENFNGFAYREVAKKTFQPQNDGKDRWTHLISCDPTATHSIEWFTHKFNLDNEFRKNTTPYKEVDIATKLVDSTEQLFLQLNNEVEAITFVLPENKRHDNAFWQSQRDRLTKLIEALKEERPDFQCPLLVIYYSDGISDDHDTLYNIPELLGFKDDKTIIDYHVLLIRKESITTRICDEMFWLFEASVTC